MREKIMAKPLISNNVKAERLAAGIGSVKELALRAGIDPTWCGYIEDGWVLPTSDEYKRLLAALGGIPADRLYVRTWRQLTKVDHLARGGGEADSDMWRRWRDESHLMMSREELNYFDRQPGLDHEAEVYVNMSCGTQRSPHLLQDTVSVLEALGVSFVAAAGPGAGCCGKPLYLHNGQQAYDRHREGRIKRSQAWGATVHVNWCGACQQIGTAEASRHQLADGVVHPVRELQLIPFLEERVRALGDRAPWKKEVHRRVLAEGHRGLSNQHDHSWDTIPTLLAMVPGVEVVGQYEGWSEISPCAGAAREGSPAPAWTQRPETPEELANHRVRLAEQIQALGGDTVSCLHQNCHQMWSRYVSDRLAVIHPISVLAEALDCRHPDRFQEAVLHGDPQRLLNESRPRWQSWGMTEQRAAEIAESICDFSMTTKGIVQATLPNTASGPTCTGGCGGCQTHTPPKLIQLP
jgi:hypothetical protein